MTIEELRAAWKDEEARAQRAVQIRDNIAAAAHLFVKYCVAGDG